MEALGPPMCIALGIDELSVDTNLVARSPDAAFEHIANAEILADLPSVDIFVPSYNEEPDLLAATLAAAKALDYPADKLTVFLLDDGGTDAKVHSQDPRVSIPAQRRRATLMALTERLDVRYLARAKNEHAKAGNLNAGMAVSDGELVAIFDAGRQTLTYANAGHPYPILRSNDGSLEELRADGLPIGLRSESPQAHGVTKRVDDAALLALYTDGLTEATRDLFAGERRLREALSSDAIFFVGSPAKFVENFCLADEPGDDVAILLLNFVPSRRWAFHSSDARAARAVRRQFLSALASEAKPESDFKAAELIYGELAANVAQHAAGTIEIALAWHYGRAVLHVTDRGEGYAASQRPPTDLLIEHGRGLWLVQRFGAQLEVELLPGYGTHVRARLPIERGDR